MQALQRSSQVLAKSLVKPQTFSPSVTRCLSEDFKKKREAVREKMQYPDDTPVFLRGGPMDRVLFGITCVIVTSGTLFTFYRVYQRAQM